LEIKGKQLHDDKHQRISLYIAAGSLVASLVVGGILGGFSVYYARGSYGLAESSDSSSSMQKESAEKSTAKQVEVLKELLIVQQQQNKLLSEIQFFANTVNPNTKVKKIAKSRNSRRNLK